MYMTYLQIYVSVGAYSKKDRNFNDRFLILRIFSYIFVTTDVITIAFFHENAE